MKQAEAICGRVTDPLPDFPISQQNPDWFAGDPVPHWVELRLSAGCYGTSALQKEGINAHLTASFGLASFPGDAKDKRELLAEADRCLFRSKNAGKNRITFAELEKAA